MQIALERDNQGAYVDFPKDKTLKSFDPADRMYVALAIAAGFETILLHAVDSDYLHHREASARYVTVKELCPDCLKKP